jgi:hypothetical protein
MRATVTIGRLGVNGGFPGGNGGAGGLRGEVTGWSASSVRSNLRFLRSVEVDQLPQHGLAFTLTIGDLCTSSEWKSLKDGLVRFMRRKLVAEHWHHVTEWQERGHPHLHGCMFFSHLTPITAISDLYDYWLGVTAHLGTSARAQHVKMLKGPVGWFQYSGKHASRGFAHYQRQADQMPEGWQNTGRMWGRSASWPVLSEKISLDPASFYNLRRFVDRWSRAQARSDLRAAQAFGDERSIKRVKGRLRFLALQRKSFGKGRSLSETRGLNEWVPADVVSDMVALAQRESAIFKKRDLNNGTVELASKNHKFILVPTADSVRREGDIPF